MQGPSVARGQRGQPLAWPKDDPGEGVKRVTPIPLRPGSPSEANRKMIFAALLESGPGPDVRLRIAHRFGVSAHTLAAIEREGTALHWSAAGA